LLGRTKNRKILAKAIAPRSAGAIVQSSDAFTALLRRAQAGEPDAATELIREYEPDIRLEVRVRLRVQDGRVRRVLDSMDIAQSVLASFFAGVTAGRFVPENPQQLLGLLVTMTRNKLLTHVRHQRQQRRDVRRVQGLDAAVHDVATEGETPSEIVAGKELLGEFRKRLSDEERQLAERRSQDQSWTEIAAALGGTPEGRRKQLERAFARVARELGLEDESGTDMGQR
jgi:RNA polymerase sigma factor (sigma-70 family)